MDTNLFIVQSPALKSIVGLLRVGVKVPGQQLNKSLKSVFVQYFDPAAVVSMI